MEGDSQMKKTILALSIALVITACGKDDASTTATAPAATAESAAPAKPVASAEESAKQLNGIYEAYFEESLKLNPVQATFLGDKRYNDQLPNFLGAEYREQSRALAQKYLDQVAAIDPAVLTGQDRLSHEIFVRERKLELEGMQYPDHLIPINQFYNVANFVVQLGSGQNAQPFVTVEDYDMWLKRVAQVPVIFDQAIANMREGMEKGIVQPRVLMEKVLPQIKAQVVAKPEDSVFYGPITNMPKEIADADRQRITAEYTAAIKDTLVPAYQKLHDFIEKEYLPKTRDTVGLAALPNGDAWYAFEVKQSTTTDKTPEEIHQIGLAEVARIQGEMEKVKAEVGFTGTLKEFFADVKKNEKLYFKTEDEMIGAYKAFRATLDPLLPKLFEVFPKADYEIRPVEAYRAASSSSGSYQPPSADGSRPGIFYANTYDLKARPKTALESLFLHEAAPGHHFQLTIQQELESLPKFRRYGGETAFAEGWGLYAESLGKELGVYTDPYMYFGALDAELWRSIRLVTDTGIHAKGWTRDQVLDYMYANSPVEPTRAISEAERFMAIPGQALAYKMGQLKIRELRTKAEQALGPKFDLRKFHTEVLRDGAVPLSVLEAKIDRWIAEVQAAPAAAPAPAATPAAPAGT